MLLIPKVTETQMLILQSHLAATQPPRSVTPDPKSQIIILAKKIRLFQRMPELKWLFSPQQREQKHVNSQFGFSHAINKVALYICS